ncbi:MAG TPA: OprD family outer membrane porin [Chitinophagaceae bacterium]
MKGFVLLIALLGAGKLWAQHDEPASDTIAVKADTLSLLQAFKKGTIHGHARYFFMSTQNRNELTDYYANAAGGGLKYESAPFRGFQVGVSGFFIYNVGSSDLSKTDPLSGQRNRYEIGLFDMEDPHNKTDIDRLEELYIRYRRGKGSVTFGKQLIHTPFINPQDTRMRPTETEGVYGRVEAGEQLQLEGGWIYRFSPRSTVRWYSVAQSIGVNTQGVNPDGSPADYAGHVETRGVALLGVTWKPSEGVQLKVFEQVTENVFHTSLVQAGFEKKAGARKWLGAVQYIRQEALGNGGNADSARAYFSKDNKVNIAGARAGLAWGAWETTVNYTRIFRGGRFTMPREWGTEPLFTYLSRERNEGLGDVNAFSATVKNKLLKQRLRWEAGYGHYYLPDVNNAALNKYGLPSYRHLKLRGDYAFGGLLKGLELALLFVYKDAIGDGGKDSRYRINKVDMASYNLILNYNF